MNIRTRCIHGSNKKYDNTGAISVPIFQSATFAHPGVEMSTGFDYSRLQNPTREHLERTVAELEKGVDAMAFCSGMAAISAVMELFAPGDHIIASDDLYGGSHRLFFQLCTRRGMSFSLANTSFADLVEAALLPETKAIFVETPTNPMMQISDLAAISRIAKHHGLLLIVDNTFLTPYCQRPLELGADIVVHSGTKYLGGHNDTIAGLLVTGSEELSERMRFIFKTTGACLSPFDSWLLIRGIKTLAVRMDRQQETALHIAQWLLEQPKVIAVHYPGLPDHPGHATAKAQSTGFGAMISFEVDNSDTARQILSRVALIQFAESLGGVESLITYPLLQTHADIPEVQREAKGITSQLLRLSVGLEAAADLCSDLQQALEENQ